MTASASTTTTTKKGRLRRGWQLARSSWRVLVLDKELLVLPVIGCIVGLLTFIAFIALAIGVSTAGMHLLHGTSNYSVSGDVAIIPILIFFVLLRLLVTLIANFFSGAIIYGASQRFHGDDPTIRGSLAGAWQKLGALSAFSAVDGTAGLLMQTVSERMPFLGQLLAVIGGLAWNIATVFAIPVIILSDKKVGPIEATKKSVGIIRQIWGEGLVAEAGIGAVTVLGLFSYLLLATLVGYITVSLHPSGAVTGSLIGGGILGLMVLLMLCGTLVAITKAAMYHYATTDEAPEMFNKELLQAAMTVKKARRLFR
ncbi:MAG TPA: DUF6159 family protein [Candidatus Saccharimonadales bacterium]|jgi:hypothetical protein